MHLWIHLRFEFVLLFTTVISITGGTLCYRQDKNMNILAGKISAYGYTQILNNYSHRFLVISESIYERFNHVKSPLHIITFNVDFTLFLISILATLEHRRGFNYRK
jgi:hypothetical protein